MGSSSPGSLACVFQVLDRGDAESYQNVSFSLGTRSVEAKLTGDALCGLEVLGSAASCRLVLLAPESLAVQLAGSPEEAVELVADWGRLSMELESGVKRLTRYAGSVEVEVIPSTGFYRTEGGVVEFRGAGRGDVELAVLHALAGKLPLISGTGEPCNVAVDISTGHNLYVAAVVRGLRAAIVAYKLAHLNHALLDGRWPGARFWVASSPPVYRDSQYSYPIHLEEVDARIFLSFPLPQQDVVSGRVKPEAMVGPGQLSDREKASLGRRWGRLFANLRRVLRVGLYMHNALRYNTPLALYYAERVYRLPGPEEPLELAGRLAVFVKSEGWRSTKVERTERGIAVSHRGVERRLALYTLLALLETAALLRLRQRLLDDVDLERGVPVGELREKFEKLIYRPRDEQLAQDLALNRRMLGRDLDEIERRAASLRPGSSALLEELLEGSERQKGGGGGSGESDVKRNFFAHSGFYRGFTEAYRSPEGELLLRYRDDEAAVSSLRMWLQDPS